MTKRLKRKFTRDFFDRCGPNVKMMVSIFEELPNIAFYIKDLDGRIVAINRYNCSLCNIPTPESAIGKRSCDLFPVAYADFSMARDRAVIESGKPIINKRYSKVANLSASVNILSIYPVHGLNSEIIGTLCVYYRDSQTNIGPVWTDKLDSILAKINENISKPISVESLAAESGMSVSNLQRMFMKTIGVRPGQYMVQQRLNAACRLLENSKLGINDIALASGFCDQSHLTKLFKRKRGVTPGEYRRQHRSISSSPNG
jgi:AraC-like DNA-binding protein